MQKSAKSRAEAEFAATLKKDKPVQQEMDQARQAAAEKTARLRALRLAKEAAGK